jgi:1,4-dihydroxy-2-naphthoyl-CoA synthase
MMRITSASINRIGIYSSRSIIWNRWITQNSLYSGSSYPFSSSAATTDRKYKYFRDVEITPDGVAVIRFDGPKSVNTICFEMKDETKKLWKEEISDNSNIKAVVFLSAKSSGFIAGADITDISSIDNKAELIPIIEDGLKLFQSMKAKGVPLVCGIDGPCLGGGLEWALWCDYRICSDSSKTKMGKRKLPVIKFPFDFHNIVIPILAHLLHSIKFVS